MNKAATIYASLVAFLIAPVTLCAATWYQATATGKTSIVVSDERASSGKQSLKFTDLPCQSPQFKQCGVIVIMSPGTKESAFYIDNLVVRVLE